MTDQPTISMDIPTGAIAMGERLRVGNPAHVKALKNSIEILGVLNPITVIRRVDDGNFGAPKFLLVAGAHRLSACIALGRETIPAMVVDFNELQRTIAECDENLCSTKLTPAERALLTEKRKVAFEALHPETCHGAIGNGRPKSRQVGAALRFTAETAARSGVSERAVQRDARRGSVIDPTILTSVQGTNLDKGTVLDELAAAPRQEQAALLAEISGRADHNESEQRVDLPLVESKTLTPTTTEALPDILAAAALIFEKLGFADTVRLLAMVTEETLPYLLSSLRAIVAAHDLIAPPVDSGGVGRVTSVVTIAVEAENAQPTSADGVNDKANEPALAKEVTNAAASASLTDSAYSVFTPSRELTYVPFDEANPASADVNPKAISSTGATQERRTLRPSNWRNTADEPLAGDQCRECKGTRWRMSSGDPTGWFCAACFEVPASQSNVPIKCTDISLLTGTNEARRGV